MTALTDGQVIRSTACPYCHASPGNRCHNGSGYTRGEIHKDRRKAAEALSRTADAGQTTG